MGTTALSVQANSIAPPSIPPPPSRSPADPQVWRDLWSAVLSVTKLALCPCCRMLVVLFHTVLALEGAALQAKIDGPVLIHKLDTHKGSRHMTVTDQAMLDAKLHEPSSEAKDPLLFKHRLQQHDATSNKLTYYEYSARRSGHVLILNQLDVQSCISQVSGSGTILNLTFELNSPQVPSWQAR